MVKKAPKTGGLKLFGTVAEHRQMVMRCDAFGYLLRHITPTEAVVMHLMLHVTENNVELCDTLYTVQTSYPGSNSFKQLLSLVLHLTRVADHRATLLILLLRLRCPKMSVTC